MGCRVSFRELATHHWKELTGAGLKRSNHMHLTDHSKSIKLLGKQHRVYLFLDIFKLSWGISLITEKHHKNNRKKNSKSEFYSAQISGKEESNGTERSRIIKGITMFVSVSNIIVFLGFRFLQSITKNVRLWLYKTYFCLNFAPQCCKITPNTSVSLLGGDQPVARPEWNPAVSLLAEIQFLSRSKLRTVFLLKF